MSARELRRAEVFGRVASHTLRLVDAAEVLALSYRQVKRLWRRYRQHGAPALQHGNAGRPSHRAKPAAFREQVLRLVGEKYSGGLAERFGPTLASEHLAEEDGFAVHEETLRRWMLAAGLWSRTRGKRRAHRRRRARKEHFGELVQLDGSFHAWFEQRGPRGCLMNMVDDATGTTGSRLGEAETIWAAAGVLRAWIERYGVPRALYTDWKNVYKIAPTPKQELHGEAPQTQFGRMCARLGIRILAAHSPQAKGRVERNHGVHQDRLVKKFRRRGMQSYAAANQYLEEEYLAAHNQRFAQPAARPEDYHRSAPSAAELDDVFRLESERWVSDDWVVRYQSRWLQLLPRSRHYGPRDKALVYESEDGRLEVRYRGEAMEFEEVAAPVPSSESAAVAVVHVPYSRPRRKPGHEHPYNRGYERAARRRRGELLKRAVAARAGGNAGPPPNGAAPSAAPGASPAFPPAPPGNPTEGTF